MREVLEQVFGNCKYPHICNCVIKNSFESISEAQFFINDEKLDQSESPIKIVNHYDEFELTVNNSELKQIHLVKTDNCLFTDETKKCDCILFDNTKFYFVEIKNSSASQRKKRRKDAREQLGATIDLLRNGNVDTSEFEITAIICFASTEPRIINSASNSARAVFFDLYKIQLEEKNLISF